MYLDNWITRNCTRKKLLEIIFWVLSLISLYKIFDDFLSSILNLTVSIVYLKNSASSCRWRGWSMIHLIIYLPARHVTVQDSVFSCCTDINNLQTEKYRSRFNTALKRIMYARERERKTPSLGRQSYVPTSISCIICAVLCHFAPSYTTISSS